MSIWLGVLGLVLIILLSSILLIFKNNTRLPHTVLLAIIGVGVGYVHLYVTQGQQGFWADIINSMASFKLSSSAIMYIFLPVLIFESAMSINVRRLLDEIHGILFLAVIGLIISTVAVGAMLHSISGMSLVVCLLLGSIVSATDPVAVVALFKDLGAPARLNILVEGESLFNDATAIVLFTILLAIISGQGEFSFLAASITFLKVFFGGVIVGLVVAKILGWVIGRCRESKAICVSLTVTIAYLSFIIAEHYFHFSGVMAVVTAGLVIGSIEQSKTTPSVHVALHDTWENIIFWFVSVIFLLSGAMLPSQLMQLHENYFIDLLSLILICTAVRFVIIDLLLPLFSRFHLVHKVNMAYRQIMIWGGLRGAVSLALALIFMESSSVGPSEKAFVVDLVIGYVFFTLLIQATTIQKLMAAFGLGRLSTQESIMRSRVIKQTRQQAVGKAFEMIANRDPSDALYKKLTHVIQQHEQLDEEGGFDDSAISSNEWASVGLRILMDREKKNYITAFDDCLISESTLKRCIINVDRMIDDLKESGLEGFITASEKALPFTTFFHLGLWLHRRLKLSQLLSSELSEMLSVLFSIKLATESVMTNQFSDVCTIIGTEGAEAARNAYAKRHKMIVFWLDGLAHQYEQYVHRLEEQRVINFALRLESFNYKQLNEELLIPSSVHASLQHDIKQRIQQHALSSSALDLRLSASELLMKVDYFSALPSDKLVKIEKMLVSYLAAPGETIVKEGDPGDAMFFISSGCVVVDTESGPIQLGCGDFFGEIALIDSRPRTATVRSLFFSELLKLRSSDFHHFLFDNPEIKDDIVAKAKERGQ